MELISEPLNRIMMETMNELGSELISLLHDERGF